MRMMISDPKKGGHEAVLQVGVIEAGPLPPPYPRVSPCKGKGGGATEGKGGGKREQRVSGEDQARIRAHRRGPMSLDMSYLL